MYLLGGEGGILLPTTEGQVHGKTRTVQIKEGIFEDSSSAHGCEGPCTRVGARGVKECSTG